MRSHKTSLQTCSNFAVFNSLSSSFRVCDYGCVSFSVFFSPFSLLNAHTLPGKLLFGFISFCCCCCLQPVSFSRAYFHPTSFRLFIFYFFAIKKKKSTQTCVQFVHPLDFVSVHALARGTDPWGNVYYRLKGACVLNSCSLPHVYVFCNGTVAVLRYFIDALLSI